MSYLQSSLRSWWKTQARNLNKKDNTKVVPSSSKRANYDIKMTSPKNKKTKTASLSESTQNLILYNSPSVKFKLSWDITIMEVVELTELAMKEILAEAGIQSYWQPWNHKLEHPGFREYLDVLNVKRYSSRTQALDSFYMWNEYETCVDDSEILTRQPKRGGELGF